jgi:hypothetical protein
MVVIAWLRDGGVIPVEPERSQLQGEGVAVKLRLTLG